MASSFVYVPALTLVQWCYPQKRGLVAGTVSMVFGLAAAIMSPLFAKMLSAFGYRGHEPGMSPFSPFPSAFWEPILPALRRLGRMPPLPGAPVGSGAKPTAKIITATKSFTVKESLHTRSFWLLWITWTFAGAAGVSMTILATGYGLFLGFPLSSAILILTAFNLTNGMSRLISGILSDRFGRNQVMSLAFLAAGVAYFVLPWADGLVACALLAAVVGFSFGTLFSVSAPLVADCFGLEHFGAIFGLTFAAYGFVAGPLGPTLSGYLLDVTGDNFFLVFLYLGIFCLLASLCIRQVVPPQSA